MLLRAAQIASVIERGTSKFKYRKPQSRPPMPKINVKADEQKALKLLGRLVLEHGLLGDKFNNVARLGCCGDCEELRFENWLLALAELLGYKPPSRSFNLNNKGSNNYTSIHGIRDFTRFLKTQKLSTHQIPASVGNLLSFYIKALPAFEQGFLASHDQQIKKLAS